MNNKPRELPNKIIKWLEKQGYPLEMYTARTFQNAGFYVKLSDYYDDFETNQPREIDITAQKLSDIEKQLTIQISFHVECKSSRDKPWILFVSDTSIDETGSFLNYAISSKILRHFLFLKNRSSDRKLFENELSKMPFPCSQHISYGITQSFSDGPDIPFKAVMSSVKSAISRVMKHDKYPFSIPERPQCAMAFPVVIIHGELFECSVSDDGKLNLCQVDSGVLYWKFPNPIHASPYVQVVTKSAIDQFAIDMKSSANKLIDIFFKDITTINQIALEVLDSQNNSN